LRKPKYLSPSALALWTRDREAYYLQYLSDNPPPRGLQTRPMSVGSSFDAWVKGALWDRYFGPRVGCAIGDEGLRLFDLQVEKQNRSFARTAGLDCWEQYKALGAWDRLYRLIDKSDVAPRMEFTEEKEVDCGGVLVPLLGKPDLNFQLASSREVVFDWKVNGYCSSASPAPGYVDLLPGGGPHKDVYVEFCDGIYVGSDLARWVTQLGVYAEICNVPGALGAVDQLCCRKGIVRVAQHRGEIDVDLSDFGKLWAIIGSGWIFRDLSLEDSRSRCALLDIASVDVDALDKLTWRG